MTKPHLTLFALLFAVGCSGSPTAPTPPPVVVVTPPVVVVTPPVVAPPVVAAPNPLLSDPRFDLAFYRMFALGSLDLGRTVSLRRHQRPPMLYIMTVDNIGGAITQATLDATAAALINTTPLWTGGMGVQGIEYGTEAAAPFITVPGRIHVQWDGATTNSGLCARSDIGGSTITVFLRSGCTPCLGLQVAPLVIKHELGHVLGFWHTDGRDDLMYPSGSACDRNPSAREQFHGRLAYSLPNGSLHP